jgi:hypothetical protein
VLDRRTANATRGDAGDAAERRRLAVDELLRTRGWARVRIEPDGHAVLAETSGSSPEAA